MINVTDLHEEQKRMPLLRLAFRPFFLFGSVFSLLAIMLWTLNLKGLISMSPVNGLFWWHSHEMLFGFVPAIVAGFLLTAVQSWTGVPSIKGSKLLFLLLVWASSRLLIITNPTISIVPIMLLDLAFLPLTGFFLAQPLFNVKQHRNMIFLPVLAFMTIANIFTYLPSLGFSAEFNTRGLHSMVLLTTLLVAVLGGRVIPMFTANGTKTTKVLPLKWLELSALSSLVVIVGLFMVGLASSQNENIKMAFGILCLFSAILNAIRILRWRIWVTLRTPLVWVLHATILFMPIGLTMISLHLMFDMVSLSNALHSLNVGVIGGMIVAMMSRVSLGHTGRPLHVSGIMVFAFISIILAAVMRGFLISMFPEFTQLLWLLSGVCWSIAFACFIWVYLPLLSAPRIDGRPG
jgi:uncharacterized protein involved in response to NO